MSRLVDLTGRRFGSLTVIERCEDKGNQPRWLCKCDCGNLTKPHASSLKRGHSKTCALCNTKVPKYFTDLTGKIFGYLKVIKRCGTTTGGYAKWLCRCECGNEKIIASRRLKNGDTRSCGCKTVAMRIKSKTKHGFATRDNTKSTYRAWSAIKSRTSNCSVPGWKHYGGRGIKMCERWQHSFSNFLKDMGEKPSGRYSIDRIDVNGDYTPENCRWATSGDQANNKRMTIVIEIDGIIKPLKEWCDKFGIKYGTAHNRIKRGWPPLKALTEPIKNYRKK